MRYYKNANKKESDSTILSELNKMVSRVDELNIYPENS
jgi:hypothetical protein